MIHLEPFTADDFEIFKSWTSSKEELIQFAGPRFSWPISNNELFEYINDPFVHAYKVVDNEKGQTIGHGEIYISDDKLPKLCRIIIGDKNFRGRGLGQQVVNELLKLAFQLSDSDKAELNVYDWNTSAFNCYRKCGFIVNPEKQKTISVDGKNWISLNMIFSKNNLIPGI